MTKRKSITKKSPTKKRKVNTEVLDSISQEHLGALAQLLIEEEYKKNNLFSDGGQIPIPEGLPTPKEVVAPQVEQPAGGGGITGAQAAQAASGAIQGTMGVISAVSDISTMKDTSGYENQLEGIKNQTYQVSSSSDFMNQMANRNQAEDIKFEEIAGTKQENRKTAGKAIGSGATAGAAVGSLFGPIGTLIGTAAGALIGGVSAWIGNSSKKAKARKKQQELLAQKQAAENQQMANATVSVDNYQSDMAANTMANYAAYGGLFNQYGDGGPEEIALKVPKDRPNKVKKTFDAAKEWAESETTQKLWKQNMIDTAAYEKQLELEEDNKSVEGFQKQINGWLNEENKLEDVSQITSEYLQNKTEIGDKVKESLVDRIKRRDATASEVAKAKEEASKVLDAEIKKDMYTRMQNSFDAPLFIKSTSKEYGVAGMSEKERQNYEDLKKIALEDLAREEVQGSGGVDLETGARIASYKTPTALENNPFHEFGHAGGWSGTESTMSPAAKKTEQILREEGVYKDEYLDAGEEAYNRLMDLRILNSMDPDEREWDEDKVNELKNKGNAMLNRYPAKVISRLLNEVALNTSPSINVETPEQMQYTDPNEGVSFAAKGGLLNRFNEGGFKNMPQYIITPRDPDTISTAPTKAERLKSKATRLGKALLNFTPLGGIVDEASATSKAIQGDTDGMINNMATDLAISGIEKLTKRKSSGTLGMLLNPGNAIANYHELQAALGHHSPMNTPEELELQRNELTWTNLAKHAYNAVTNNHADGGPLFNEFSNGVTIINEGGSHESNPYEGIQVGVDPQGTPNLVEEGEVIFNDYVFSDRIKVPNAIRHKYKLRNKKDLTFADAAKEIQKESEEMPNDSIARRTMEVRLTELMQEQEVIRMRRQNRKKEKNTFSKGGQIAGTILQAAPALGSLLAVGNDVFGGNKPDYSQVEKYEKAINNAYQPVEAKTLSDYIEYNPYDTSLALNRLGANQAASRRAIMNTSAGNSAAARAAILASDYNYGNQIGDTYRTAREYNDANREKVASFNRATNQYNATAIDSANRFNAQLAANKADAIAKAGQWRDQITQANRAEKSANLTGLYESIAGLGQTLYNQGQVKMLQDNGIIVGADGKLIQIPSKESSSTSFRYTPQQVGNNTKFPNAPTLSFDMNAFNSKFGQYANQSGPFIDMQGGKPVQGTPKTGAQAVIESGYKPYEKKYGGKLNRKKTKKRRLS